MIGQKLLNRGLLSEKQLATALAEQKATGAKLGEILIRSGFVTEVMISTILAEEAGVKQIDLEECFIEPEIIRLIPERLAREYKIIPVGFTNNVLVLAMADTFDVEATDKIRQETGLAAEVVSATESDIISAISRYYGEEEVFDKIVTESVRQTQTTKRRPLEEFGAIIELVNSIIAKGVKEKATDIHFEPEETTFRIRYRIDGFLQQGFSLPKDLTLPVISRIKIMAGLDISEQRLPQDGKFCFLIGSRKVDLRVSTFPLNFGEKAVLRLLDRETLILGFEELGLAGKNLAKFKEILGRSQGIVLIVGPTGSGKTTTLYSALSNINTLDRNIITLEDPIEYDLPGINQSQINPKAGLTFATGLRSILRQDPDVILIGEMRDIETVELAIRAALTGHLVFSTLHANDAASAIPRLRDMEAIPSLMASAIVGIVGQRLVRMICEKCKTETEAPLGLLKKLGVRGIENFKNSKFYRGAGCQKCNSGYKGRIGIFEIMSVTPLITELIIKEGTDRQTLQTAARKEGMKTMLEDGIRKAIQGLTTLEEVVRVAV